MGEGGPTLHLNAIPETTVTWIGDAVALGQDFIPQIHKRPHFAHFGNKAYACIYKE